MSKENSFLKVSKFEGLTKILDLQAERIKKLFCLEVIQIIQAQIKALI